MQKNLIVLGYTGANGHAIKADGDFGPNTKHAVEAFQRDHHLVVDGIAGPKTLEAIRHPAQASKVPGLDNAANPDHGLYLQAQKAVHELDAHLGRTPDQQSNNLAAALTVAAKHQGMIRIDQVALSEDGANAFASARHAQVHGAGANSHCGKYAHSAKQSGLAADVGAANRASANP